MEIMDAWSGRGSRGLMYGNRAGPFHHAARRDPLVWSRAYLLSSPCYRFGKVVCRITCPPFEREIAPRCATHLRILCGCGWVRRGRPANPLPHAAHASSAATGTLHDAAALAGALARLGRALASPADLLGARVLLLLLLLRRLVRLLALGFGTRRPDVFRRARSEEARGRREQDGLAVDLRPRARPVAGPRRRLLRRWVLAHLLLKGEALGVACIQTGAAAGLGGAAVGLAPALRHRLGQW